VSCRVCQSCQNLLLPLPALSSVCDFESGRVWVCVCVILRVDVCVCVRMCAYVCVYVEIVVKGALVCTLMVRYCK